MIFSVMVSPVFGFAVDATTVTIFLMALIAVGIAAFVLR